jgi:hypothetical protein
MHPTAEATAKSTAMHPTSHAAAESTTVHSAAHATSHSAAMPAASTHTAAAATTAAQCRRGKTKRCGKGARNEAIKDLVVHPNSSSVQLPRRFSPQREDAKQSQRVQYFK